MSEKGSHEFYGSARWRSKFLETIARHLSIIISTDNMAVLNAITPIIMQNDPKNRFIAEKNFAKKKRRNNQVSNRERTGKCIFTKIFIDR